MRQGYVAFAREAPPLPLKTHQCFLDVVSMLAAQYALTLVHTVAPLPRSALSGEHARLVPRSSNAEWLEALVGGEAATWILSLSANTGAGASVGGGGGGGGESVARAPAAAAAASDDFSAHGVESLCVRLASAEWSAKQLLALAARLQAESTYSPNC